MNIHQTCTLTFAMVVLSGGSLGQPPPVQPRTDLTPLMQMKLEQAKGILEGLTLDDHEAIGRHARALKLLSMESGWNVIQTDEYEAQSKEFRRLTGMISEAAEQKELHRAALGYVSLTMHCIECHRYMRQHRSGPSLQEQ